jgi:hypothetical protein
MRSRSNKNKTMIELPQLRHKTAGLTKVGKNWRIIYYDGGKLKTRATSTDKVNDARKLRDAFHARAVQEGATYKGSNASSAVTAAVNDPGGDACIYTQVSYRVLVEGVHVTTTTDKELAKQRRNEYIAAHYDVQ